MTASSTSLATDFVADWTTILNNFLCYINQHFNAIPKIRIEQRTTMQRIAMQVIAYNTEQFPVWTILRYTARTSGP
ncbi:hypothetical protein J6590_072731 [Homalodisca vitripennis]|nr:hypothetical protein J6590_072731 [Homalodisca vitripennis]